MHDEQHNERIARLYFRDKQDRLNLKNHVSYLHANKESANKAAHRKQQSFNSAAKKVKPPRAGTGGAGVLLSSSFSQHEERFMSKAKEVRAILAEIARLRSRARQLQKRVDAIGYLLECNTDGGMVGCGRKTFVAKAEPAAGLDGLPRLRLRRDAPLPEVRTTT